ncbi:velvet factor-domain-containing protein [Syncephalis fuscata]|nr:velvet factor-domain-containing protein [Syncephalis fuscata]
MSLRSRVEELSTRPYFTAPKMIERNDNDNFVVFQQPQRARAANSKDATERRAVDPPPVLKLQLSSTTPVAEDCTKYIALAVLMPASSWDHSSALELKNKQPNAMNGAHRDTTTHTSTAVGTWASAAYLLRSSEESEERHIFFIFPDLGVKRPGMFCIHFLLYERVGTMVKWLKSTVSNPFTVYSARLFPGVLESTMLSRIFVSQGVKIRLRNSQQTENQLPLKTEINNNPRLLPGRYLLAPSGIPADINRSSSSIATSMLLSSRDTSPIATSPIHYTQPASHTFADDKLLPTTKACYLLYLQNIQNHILHPYSCLNVHLSKHRL